MGCHGREAFDTARGRFESDRDLDLVPEEGPCIATVLQVGFGG